MDNMTITEFENFLAELDANIAKLRAAAERAGDKSAEAEATRLSKQRDIALKRFFEKLTAWDNVLLARHPDRPYSQDYIGSVCDDFTELHGDRLFGDDGALVGGLARFAGQSVVVLGQQKGRDLKERQKRNFGYMRPEGYRKALRLMQLAGKFQRPVLSFVDTPGADPNVGSEERGISEAIARNLREMSVLPTPTIAIVIGEGGSGGALGIAVCDRVLMLSHSFYSVIAPEGCAAIITRDAGRASDAARWMRVTAKDALELDLIDEVVPEPLGGAHRDPAGAAEAVKEALTRHLEELNALPTALLLEQRADRLRSMGRFLVK
ncbi:MAG: acetyl-CoA carboxylase carboxyltransferase subunit alpha [Armatimonas sp.]